MEEMSKIVKEFVGYIGLSKLEPELVFRGNTTLLCMTYNFDLQPGRSELESVKNTLEPLMKDLLTSDALKAVVDPLQKEIKELKTKLIELNKFKEFYELQYILNHGKGNPNGK